MADLNPARYRWDGLMKRLRCTLMKGLCGSLSAIAAELIFSEVAIAAAIREATSVAVQAASSAVVRAALLVAFPGAPGGGLIVVGKIGTCPVGIVLLRISSGQYRYDYS